MIIEQPDGRASTPPLQKKPDNNRREEKDTVFSRHRRKFYECDSRTESVHLLRNARLRLPQFFRTRSGRGQPWTIEGAEANIAARKLRIHVKIEDVGGGKTEVKIRKKRGPQIHHTDLQLMNMALDYVNVQNDDRGLTWLELRRDFTIANMAQKTGFAESTVNEWLRRMRENKLLRTERQKNPEKDRERPARRWLTPAFFAILGLSKKLEKQKAWAKEQNKDEQRAAQARLRNAGPAAVTAFLPGGTGGEKPRESRVTAPRDTFRQLHAILGRERHRPPDD